LGEGEQQGVGVGMRHLDQLGYPDKDSRLLPNNANASAIGPWTAQTAVNGHRRQNIHNCKDEDEDRVVPALNKKVEVLPILSSKSGRHVFPDRTW